VQIDLSHDPGVVYEHIQTRKIPHDIGVKGADSRRVARVALDRMDAREFLFGSVELGLASSGDNHRVAKRHELGRKLETDTGCSAGNENRIAREIHGRLHHAAFAKTDGCTDRAPMHRRFHALIMAIAIDRSVSSFSENWLRASS